MATDEPTTSPDSPENHTAREYIRIRPTTDPIHPEQVAQAFRKAHALTATDDGGLFSSTTTPTIEILLVTPADSQRVEYLIGVEDANLDALDRVLDVCFPNSYERTHTSATPTTTHITATDDAHEDTVATDSEEPAPTTHQTAGLELLANADGPTDWRTRLTPFEQFHQPDATDQATWPLGSVLSALAATDTAVVVQTLLQPKPNWAAQRDEQVYKLRNDYGTSFIGTIWNSLDSRPPSERPDTDPEDLPPDTQARIEELEAVDPRRSFTVNTRAVAVADPDALDPAAALADLGDAFQAAGHTTYQLTTRHAPTNSDTAARIYEDLTTRRIRTTDPERTIPAGLPLLGEHVHTTRPGIVADPETVGTFCAVGGASLPETARRAIQTQSRDSVPRPLPPEDILDQYRTEGFDLGPPLDTDGQPDSPALALPPALQRRHVAIVGQTGAGKGMFAIPGVVANHAATDGATIIFEPKDGVFADDYLRAHYAAHGNLEAVYRFDAHEFLPAAPIFDIEPAMDSGLSRTQAIAAVVERLEDMLKAVWGVQAYEDAKTSSRVIRAVTKSLFDPIHGETQCTLIDIIEVLARMARTGSAPPVSDDQLRRTLADIVDNNQDTFTEIIRAATRRLGRLADQEQLAPQLTYAPDATAETDRFDWREKLDEDCVIILDTSALEANPQRVFTMLTLSQLWTALRRRRREQRDTRGHDDLANVTIHVEEAADVATSGALQQMLKDGRAYGVGISLSMQFLGQLEHVDERAYVEAINNTGTIIAGQTNLDGALAQRLATSEYPRDAVANRLRALDPGEWLCSLTGSFDGGNPRPFTIASGPLPPGHPAGPEPLTEALEVTYDAATAKVEARSRAHGLVVAESEQPASTGSGAPTTAATPTAASDPAPNAGRPTLDTTGPFTKIHPEGVRFTAERNAWVCTTCETAHGASLEKLLRAVDCHGSLADLSRDAVPTVAVDCSLTRAERDQLPYDDAQLVFMQLLYNVWQGEYDTEWEFDIVWDGMDELVAYAGLDDAALSDLITDGVVVQDTTHPQPIYSLTADGRDVIQAAHREGTAHGDGHGDLSESNFHRMLVETMARGFQTAFVDDADHPGAAVSKYHGVDDGRLDVAVLDADGEVVVAGEAERSNHDTLRAVPADYDKMAACEPERAVWVVPNRPTGHEVIRALHSPPDGQPRVAKTYDDATHLSMVSIETDGLTDMSTIGTFRKQYLDADE